MSSLFDTRKQVRTPSLPLTPPGSRHSRLGSQLTFYGAYHNNPINVGIHLCCIPLLVWCVLCLS